MHGFMHIAELTCCDVGYQAARGTCRPSSWRSCRRSLPSRPPSAAGRRPRPSRESLRRPWRATAWNYTITRPNGKADTAAIAVLADIVFWYRSRKVYDDASGRLRAVEKRFASDMLQKSYDQLAEKLNMTKGQVKAANRRTYTETTQRVRQREPRSESVPEMKDGAVKPDTDSEAIAGIDPDELGTIYRAVDKASGMPKVIAAKGRPRHSRA